MRFRATLQLLGGTSTGFEVPEEIVTGLGGGRRPAVAVTINGRTWRSRIMPYSGRILLGISAENRAETGIAAGDVVDVEVELDQAPREVVVPDDLATALAADPAARDFFDKLSYTNRKEYVRWIEEAKRPETRATRLTRAIEQLREGRTR
ncbi:MAG TPA: YdeI/OmpD-associated family protein [Rugosimonospora sp.]|nr:YdeI/OmpD-associated family protein [Rugosimonospora sp.]